MSVWEMHYSVPEDLGPDGERSGYPRSGKTRSVCMDDIIHCMTYNTLYIQRYVYTTIRYTTIHYELQRPQGILHVIVGVNTTAPLYVPELR